VALRFAGPLPRPRHCRRPQLCKPDKSHSLNQNGLFIDRAPRSDETKSPWRSTENKQTCGEEEEKEEGGGRCRAARRNCHLC
jgi:hypothetical protein